MKLYRNIIIIVAVLALLGGALFFVSRYNPEGEQAPTQGEQSAEPEMINVYKAEKSKLQSIHVHNANEEYTLEYVDNKWVANGDASIRISQTAADALAHSLTNIAVKQTVSENSADAAGFGFDAPIGFAELSFSDGTAKKITVGSSSLDNENYYIMISDDPNVYLKNAYGTESMIPSLLSLRDMSFFKIDTSDLSNLKHYYMEKQGNTPVKLENINIGTEENPNDQWKMLEPVYAEVNGQVFVDSVIEKITEFTATAVVEDHPKDYAIYGLDTPYATFSIGIDDTTYRFKIGNETESLRYIKEDSSDTVYVMRKSELTFLDVAYMDLMSNLIHVEYIKDVDRLEVIASSKVYNMEIKGDKYFIDGKEIEKEAFSKAYQAIIGISLDSLDLSEEPAYEPEAQVKYYKKDGSVVTVNFLPIDERNYRVTVDGQGNSITGKKNFNEAVDKIITTYNEAK